jgi:hypothetical protein
MTLQRIIRIRDAVNGLCRAIDSGDVTPTELEMLALGELVVRDGGPLAHDLLCQLASRCRNGRKVLDSMDRAKRS